MKVQSVLLSPLRLFVTTFRLIFRNVQGMHEMRNDKVHLGGISLLSAANEKRERRCSNTKQG